MRLSEKYRPRTLGEIIGQGAARALEVFALEPYAACWLLEGPGGTGKTAAALALAHDLGCSEWGGVHVVPASELTIDKCRQLFEHTLRLRPLDGSPWQVLVIEELELVASAQVNSYLKTALSEGAMLPRLVVVATSNDAAKLDKALRQRFKIRPFSAGAAFAQAVQDRLTEIWSAEMGERPMPPGWMEWGWDGEQFSARLALDAMEDHLLMLKAEAVAA